MAAEYDPVGGRGAQLTNDFGRSRTSHVQRQIGHIAPQLEQTAEAFLGCHAANGDGVARLAWRCWRVEEAQIDAGVDD
jgi:hypothetical protein